MLHGKCDPEALVPSDQYSLDGWRKDGWMVTLRFSYHYHAAQEKCFKSIFGGWWPRCYRPSDPLSTDWSLTWPTKNVVESGSIVYIKFRCIEFCFLLKVLHNIHFASLPVCSALCHSHQYGQVWYFFCSFVCLMNDFSLFQDFSYRQLESLVLCCLICQNDRKTKQRLLNLLEDQKSHVHVR